jgi:peptidoglycan hydrolase FlgJ
MADLTSSSLLSSLPANTSPVKDNYLDQNSLNSVKAMGRHNDPQALKEIAKKFEGMFVQQMLKSMRDANAVFEEGDFTASDEMKFHQDMMDQQMVINLTSGRGIGIAQAMYQQMQKNYGKKDAVISEKTLKPLERPAASALLNSLEKPLVSMVDSVSALAEGVKSAVAKTPQEFINQVKPYAEKAAAALHIGVDVVLAQAALETGWGKHLIHDASGENSFNLFNIKASGDWQGKRISVSSLEHKDGLMQQERSAFRCYDNLQHSFADYVSLIKDNPRYENARAAGLDSAEYANALQKSGYATDPEYAQKIKKIIASPAIQQALGNQPPMALNNAKAPSSGVSS